MWYKVTFSKNEKRIRSILGLWPVLRPWPCLVWLLFGPVRRPCPDQRGRGPSWTPAMNPPPHCEGYLPHGTRQTYGNSSQPSRGCRCWSGLWNKTKQLSQNLPKYVFWIMYLVFKYYHLDDSFNQLWQGVLSFPQKLADSFCETMSLSYASTKYSVLAFGQKILLFLENSEKTFHYSK